MSEDDALLRAILDDPDDDAPRLIYADWLDEHADPTRATFIRTQIELARLPADDPNRSRLVQVERTLWRANREAWTNWVPGWAKFSEFRRGFLQKIQCGVAEFLANSDELRSKTPLVAVRLDGPEELAVPLFRSRVLDGLKALRISVYVPSMAWERFGECPYLTSLVELDVGSNAHGEELVAALISSSAFPALKILRMSWLALGDETIARLVGHPWVARLRKLDLGRNHISDEGVQALLDSPHLDRVAWLNLRGNPLTEQARLVNTLKERFGDRVQV